jgi:two-component system sensor histidine kinase AlgZ
VSPAISDGRPDIRAKRPAPIMRRMPTRDRAQMGTASQPHPLHALFQPPALIGALLAGEGLALILSLAPGIDEGLLVRFGLASLGIQWIALATIGTLYVLKAPLSRLPVQAAAPVALGVLLLATLGLSTVAVQVFGQVGFEDSRARTLFVVRTLAIALVVGLIGLVIFQNYWTGKRAALRAKQAELDALQARIRPHFLFNALNTGIALVHARPEATEQLLLDLSDLFRAAISGREQVSLAEELALTQRYLEIERLRFGERLEVRWDVPSDEHALPQAGIPPLSIQPLVENAIKHGIEPSRKGGYVAVSMQATAAEVVVEVRNSLPAEAGMPSTGHGIGLRAVRSRIQVFTGGEGDVVTRLVDGEHVATLRLPRAE